MSLLVNKKHRIQHVKLNRPHKRNALTLEMCEGIVEAIESAERDREIGCTLISACGQVFSAGMDIDERVSASSDQLNQVHDRLFTIGSTALKPIVIAVNGAALGGGLGLAVQGHVVVAESTSVFALPEIRLGLWPFLVYRAVEMALGPRRTLALSLTGRSFHAQDALSWGLIHQVCPDDEVYDRGHAIARDLGKASPIAIEAGMRYVREARGKSWEEAGRVGAILRDELMQSDDYKEGCEAFKSKREPHWPSMPEEFYTRVPS